MPSTTSTNDNNTMSSMVPPPGPFLQNLNALLHQEPMASVAHAVYWIFCLTVVAPVGSIFLVAQAAYAVAIWALGWTGQDTYHPQKQMQQQQQAAGGVKELAVVITGCDTGFGKELALIASQAGFQVFAGCLSRDSFTQFKETTIIPIVMDVTKDDDVQAAVKAVQEWIADKSSSTRVLHGLCNNAGILVPGFVDWNDLSAVQKTMDVNFMGLVRCCKAFLPIMKQQVKQGTHTGARILNIASAAGKLPCCGHLTAYGASKHAVVAFSHGLRVDLLPFRIQVSTFCPTFHGTPMVQDAPNRFEEYWKCLSKETVEEYGDDYIAYSTGQSIVAHQTMWRMDVVVDQLMKALTAQRLPAEVMVGADAKFVISFFRMLPHWVVDLLLRYHLPRPVPACLRKKA